MTKKILIASLALGLSAIAAGLCGCASMQQPYLDDAYYYPDKNAPAPATASEAAASVQSGVSGASAPSTPAMEIISAKDTTITVRIKR